MSLLSNAVNVFLQVIEYLIFIRVIVSWLPISGENKVLEIMHQLTEPILSPIRNMIELSEIGRNTTIDFSPIIAILIIGFIRHYFFGASLL